MITFAKKNLPMASIKDLKKDINYVLGDIIEATYIAEIAKSGKPSEKTEAIVDDAIQTFDNLITKLNVRGVENKKAHFKQINQELETKAKELIGKINSL